MSFAVDRLILTPADLDPVRSPISGMVDAETRIVGAFNPALTRLPAGNLLMMVRVAETLARPRYEGHVHALRRTLDGMTVDGWPLELADTSDPAYVGLSGGGQRIVVPTAFSWLLPVELSADGLHVEAVHYDRAIVPDAAWAAHGLEDARISRIDGRWWMTAAGVGPERVGTLLYSSADATDWRFEDLILDHHNRDAALFEGRIGGDIWAQIRPLGEFYHAYPPGSEWRAGAAIALASSPDGLHWKPCRRPGIRPHARTISTVHIAPGAPPIAHPDGWLSLWRGAEPHGPSAIASTYWSILDRDDPSREVRTSHPPLIEPAPHLLGDAAATLPATTTVSGIVDGGDHYIVASGEGDHACRITHVPASAFSG